MGKRWAIGWTLAGLLVSACAHGDRKLPPPKDEPFRIGSEDVLDIAVWRDGDLSRVVPVRPDGYISLPIIGEVKAEGKTPLELSKEISERLLPYIQEPRVTVIVREVHSSQVFVTGEVARPGSYPVRGKISLLQVVALAGGFSEFADRDGIVVVRPGADGGRFPVSYSELMSSDDPARSVLLMPGDTVVVP